MDTESIKNIYHVSLATVIFEILTLLLYLFTRTEFNLAILVNISSVLYCIIVCLVSWLTAIHFLKKKSFSHRFVSAFRFLFFLALASWAVWNGYRQYIRGEQVLTFFAVMLILVCFVPVKPWHSIFLSFGIYAGLFVVLFGIDRAVGIHKINYMALCLVSLMGMIVRYHSQIRTSDRAVRLQKNNEQLEYNNRHDALTKLRNRYALNADVNDFAGKQLTAFMIDVNYFKEINDTYGHAVGDEVLKLTARTLENLFPNCLCYRFGGDEFLIVDVGGKSEKVGFYTFDVNAFPSGKVMLSIGDADGSPKTHKEFFDLLAQADAKLYEMKRFTHAPENGGHDRRKRR